MTLRLDTGAADVRIPGSYDTVDQNLIMTIGSVVVAEVMFAAT